MIIEEAWLINDPCVGARARLFWQLENAQVNGAMAPGWSTEATRALVSVWSQENVQSELDGVSRNRTIFERISK